MNCNAVTWRNFRQSPIDDCVNWTCIGHRWSARFWCHPVAPGDIGAVKARRKRKTLYSLDVGTDLVLQSIRSTVQVNSVIYCVYAVRGICILYARTFNKIRKIVPQSSEIVHWKMQWLSVFRKRATQQWTWKSIEISLTQNLCIIWIASTQPCPRSVCVCGCGCVCRLFWFSLMFPFY